MGRYKGATPGGVQKARHGCNAHKSGEAKKKVTSLQRSCAGVKSLAQSVDASSRARVSYVAFTQIKHHKHATS